MSSRRTTSKHLTPRQRQARNRRNIKIMLVIAAILLLPGLIRRQINSSQGRAGEGEESGSTDFFEQDSGYNSKYEDLRPEIDVDLLDVNSYSRPGIAIDRVNGIVVHYTANPGTSAKANRDYFNNLQSTHTTKASSHFVIGLEGEIIQCVPCKEIAYASNNRNSDTLSIECCIEDDSGKFNEKTYASVVELVGWLVLRYDLDVEDVIRHYDVTGKICPKYFVEHEDAWETFKEDVAAWVHDHK